MFKKIWADPVGSKVISGVIFAMLASIGAYFHEWWWPATQHMLAQALAFIKASSTIPNWILGILGLLVLVAVLAGAMQIWRLLLSSLQPGWQGYTSDIFHGLKWRWRYSGHGIVDMYPFCPRCDYQLRAMNASHFISVYRTSFHCDHCNAELGTFDESFESLANKAERFAQQKIRNGQWPAQSS